MTCGMTSTPLKTATHVLSAATIIVAAVGGLALLAPPLSHREPVSTPSDVMQTDVTPPQNTDQELEVAVVDSDDNRPAEKVALNSERRMIESKLWLLQQQINRLESPIQPDAEPVADQLPQKDSEESVESTQFTSQEPASKPSPSEPSLPAKPSSVMKGELCEGRIDRYVIDLQNADVREALMMLGHLAKLNVVVAPSVRGNISAVSLQDVSAEDALTAITKSLGLVAEKDGQLVYVATAEESQRREQGQRTTALKIYRPQHIPVQQLEKLIAPLLTKPIYLMTLRNSPSSSATPAEAGSPQSEGVLIVDDPKVIARIDELVEEVDQPTVLATRPDSHSRPAQTAQPLNRTRQADGRTKTNSLRKISATAPLRFNPPESATELLPTADESP